MTITGSADQPHNTATLDRITSKVPFTAAMAVGDMGEPSRPPCAPITCSRWP